MRFCFVEEKSDMFSLYMEVETQEHIRIIYKECFESVI